MSMSLDVGYRSKSRYMGSIGRWSQGMVDCCMVLAVDS